MAIEKDIFSNEYADDACDGCGRKIAIGEEFLTGIESCCGGGCSRHLCRDCVIQAYELLVKIPVSVSSS